MALYPAPSGMKMTIQSAMAHNSGQHVNVFHFALASGAVATQANCIALMNDYITNVIELYQGMFYTDFTIQRIAVETLTPEPRTGSENLLPRAGTRTPSSQSMPSYVTSKISWGTGFLSRRFRGRSYFSGLREEDHTEGTIVGAGAYDVAQTAWLSAHMVRYGDDGSLPTPYVFCILSDPDRVLPEGIVGVGQETPQLAGVNSNRTYGATFPLRRRMPGIGA